MGWDGGGGHWLVRMVVPSRMVSVSASVNLPLHYKVQTFCLLAPAHPGGPGKRAVKWLCVWLCSHANIISSIKPEEHSILYCHQMRPCIENFVKFAHMFFEVYEHSERERQTDIERDRQTMLTAILSTHTGLPAEKSICISCAYIT